MSRKPSLQYDLSDLRRFARTLGQGYHVKVGIMGDRSARKQAGPSNADVGLAMEYGVPEKHVPPRSFLRMPVWLRSSQILTTVGQNAMMWLLKGNKKQILVELGIACETAIGAAFESWGFGFWQALSPKTIKRKIQQNPQPLVNTSQLRRAISSVVEKI